jgi:RHS repeat-associated protein
MALLSCRKLSVSLWPGTPSPTNVTASYDGYGRLTEHTQSGAAALAFGYNGLDDRVSQSEGGVVQRFVYDSMGRIVGEYATGSASGPSAIRGEYIYLHPDAANDNPSPHGGDDGVGGYGLLTIMTPDASAGGAITAHYPHSNHLGAPLFSTDASGAMVTPGAYAQPVFPGQLRTRADLYYNRHRDYDPTTGRYIQADPLGLDGDANPYLYALGNPMSFIDPEGLETYWEHYTGLPDSYRKNAINTIAGWSDTYSFGITYGVRALLGINGDVAECSPYYAAGALAGSISPGGPIQSFRYGREFRFGKVRIAPFGNRNPLWPKSNPTGRFPHYHIDKGPSPSFKPRDKRHRPWDSKPSDKSFLDRFF